jgi:hypothetical protein
MAPSMPPTSPPNDERHQTFRTVITLYAKAKDVAAAENLPEDPTTKQEMNSSSIENQSAAAESEPKLALALRLVAEVTEKMKHAKQGPDPSDRGSGANPKSQCFTGALDSSPTQTPQDDDKTLNRSLLDSLATSLLNGHEIVATGTNISAAAWSERKVQRSQGLHDSEPTPTQSAEAPEPPIEFFVTPNPRKLKTFGDPSDALTWQPPDFPTFKAFTLGPECDIDPSNPFPYLGKHPP